MPTLTDGETTVIGGYITQLTFLAQSNQGMFEKMYPRNNQTEIDSHMQWFQSIFKPISSKFVRQMIGTKAFGDRQPSQAELNEVWTEIHQMILPRLEQHLKDKARNFFCSEDDVTIVDVQYYNEMQQISLLDSNRELEPEKFPEIAKWIARVQKAF